MVVRDDQAGARHPLGLVGEQVAPLRVRVIRNDIPSGDDIAPRASVEHLQKLEGLGPGGGAGVEHRARRLDVQEEWRDHAGGLLPCDVSSLGIDLLNFFVVYKDLDYSKQL